MTRKFLIFGGKTGWIGQQMAKIVQENGDVAICAESRLENQSDVINEIDKIKPDYVYNCAGLTGRPNVDWCEDHKDEVIRVNVIGTLNLIDICDKKKIHLTNFATGCIYEYDEKHPMGSGIGFTEEDKPNFDGSFYSKTKGMVDQLIRIYNNLLTLRIRMPLSDDLSPRNFITKIIGYKKVINIPNSMTILYDLLPVAYKMSIKNLKGVYNFCNPGVISHNEILDLYTKYIDNNFKYINFTIEEQDQILKSKRSNNELDASKLIKDMPECKILNIKESAVKLFERMAVNLNKK